MQVPLLYVKELIGSFCIPNVFAEGNRIIGSMRLCVCVGGGVGFTVFTSKLSHVFDISHDITLGCQQGGARG